MLWRLLGLLALPLPSWADLVEEFPRASSSPRRLAAIDAPVLKKLSVLLSTGNSALVEWTLSELRYSLTVPQEAVAAAVVLEISSLYSDVIVTLIRPEDGYREVLVSGQPSAYGDVPTEEAASLVLQVQHATRATNYSVLIIRSTITANFEFRYPDPAKSAPPQATLTGLVAIDAFGTPLPLDPPFFDPRHSQYLAAMSPMSSGGTGWTRVLASKNDPGATLELRKDGGEWEPMESGIASAHVQVPRSTWLLIEVKVASTTITEESHMPDPLIYQLLVSREVRCHVRCRSCFGTEANHCLSCRAPLVLYNGSCAATACPPNGYYEWSSYQCRTCHASCAQCNGPGANACTLCPALHFLSPIAWEEPNGPCVLFCPTGMFAHPASRRCRKPPTAPVKTFYLRFQFRHPFQEFQKDFRLQETCLNATAFVLGLSLSDIRAYRLRKAQDEQGYTDEDSPPQLFVEVVSPFLPKDEADQALMDTWFGAFEIPLDEVVSFTWDEMHPPLPPLPVDAFLPSWAWGLLVSSATGVLLIIPMYCCYFRRLANTRKKYQASGTAGVDPAFVDKVVHQAEAKLVQRFILREDGAREFKDND